MKKLLVLLLTGTLVFASVGCGGKKEGTTGTNNEAASGQTEDTAPAEDASAGDSAAQDTQDDAASPDAADENAETEPEAGDGTASGSEKSEGVMTYEEYIAADLDTEVVVETYVQAKQSWWEDKATVYTQDEDGGYFLYNMACSEEDYEKLTVGTKIKVTGYKSEWEGEVEIIDATFEIVDGNYVAKAEDITSLLGSDDLINHQNEFVAFKGMTVEASKADGEEVAYLYNWDGSGQDGDDLYFNVSLDGTTYTFTVESYLCDNTTDVYKAVKELNIGDKIDMEGFLYWYQGANPHITSIKTAN